MSLLKAPMTFPAVVWFGSTPHYCYTEEMYWKAIEERGEYPRGYSDVKEIEQESEPEFVEAKSDKPEIVYPVVENEFFNGTAHNERQGKKGKK